MTLKLQTWFLSMPGEIQKHCSKGSNISEEISCTNYKITWSKSSQTDSSSCPYGYLLKKINASWQSSRLWNIQETWPFRWFRVASSLPWTQHKKTNISIRLQNKFHNDTLMVLKQVWEWSYLYEYSHELSGHHYHHELPWLPTDFISSSECNKYIRICLKFWANHYINICAEFLLQFWKQQGDSVMMLGRTQET